MDEVLYAQGLPFEDVREGAWYERAVSYVYYHDLMQGTGKNLFAPKAHLTRAEMVQILYNRDGDGQKAEKSPFEDVKAGTWYCDAVAWAAEQGYDSGYGNGRFGPEDRLTREQLAIILYGYAGKPETSGSLADFSDSGSVRSYARKAMQWAVEQHIIGGTAEGKLEPQGFATRAEAAAMIRNYFTNPAI